MESLDLRHRSPDLTVNHKLVVFRHRFRGPAIQVMSFDAYARFQLTRFLIVGDTLLVKADQLLPSVPSC